MSPSTEPDGRDKIASEMRMFNSLFLYCFCREYGINPKLGIYLNELAIKSGDDVVNLTKADVDAIPVPQSFRAVIVGAVSHYSIKRNSVDQIISRRAESTENIFRSKSKILRVKTHHC